MKHDSFQHHKRLPALGAAEGVRQDVQAAKETGVPYDPRGIGVAWTHDFLNKKPWHPMNFRNRARVWEAEQRNQEEQASKDRARKEFEAEQHYLKTISMLSPEERERYRQRQSVSWLYMKPPGYSESGGNGGRSPSAQVKVQAQVQAHKQEQEQEQGGGAAMPGPIPHSTRQKAQSQSDEHVSKVLKGIRAASQRQLELKNTNALSSSLSFGNLPDDENQRFVMPSMDSEDEERAFQLLKMSEQERNDYFMGLRNHKKRRKKSKPPHVNERSKVQEAKEFLRSVGINVTDSDEDNDADRDEERMEKRLGLKHTRCTSSGKDRKHSSRQKV